VTPELPPRQRADFDSLLSPPGAASAPAAGAAERLLAHYEELRRWAPRTDLVGPGAAAELLERHYGEALAALPWLPAGPARLVDLGSGAGFPGFVLAAARPDLEVWLVEPRERKAAFLRAAARRAGLSLTVVVARVGAAPPPGLPDEIALVTLRALRLEPRAWRGLLPKLRPAARLLAWTGAEPPPLPVELVAGRSLLLPGSRGRRLREFVLAPREAG